MEDGIGVNERLYAVAAQQVNYLADVARIFDRRCAIGLQSDFDSQFFCPLSDTTDAVHRPIPRGTRVALQIIPACDHVHQRGFQLAGLL